LSHSLLYNKKGSRFTSLNYINKILKYIKHSIDIINIKAYYLKHRSSSGNFAGGDDLGL